MNTTAAGTEHVEWLGELEQTMAEVGAHSPEMKTSPWVGSMAPAAPHRFRILPPPPRCRRFHGAPAPGLGVYWSRVRLRRRCLPHRGSRRRPWGRRRLREGEDEGTAAAGFGGFCGLSRKRERPVAAISTNLESGIG
jgi:hypothetical protein